MLRHLISDALDGLTRFPLFLSTI